MDVIMYGALVDCGRSKSCLGRLGVCCLLCAVCCLLSVVSLPRSLVWPGHVWMGSKVKKGRQRLFLHAASLSLPPDKQCLLAVPARRCHILLVARSRDDAFGYGVQKLGLLDMAMLPIVSC